MNIIHNVNVIHKSTDRRMQRRAARRDRMLDAAMGLVAREGVGALTVARLAEALAQSATALYRTFPGKAGLLLALQERAIDALAGEVREELERAVRRLRARPLRPPAGELALLLAALAPFVEGHRRAPARHRLIDGLLSAPEALLSDEELARGDRRLRPLLGLVGERLDACAACGALQPGDAGVRARVIWAALHGLDHLRKRDRAEPPALRSPRLVAATLHALLRGFGAPEPALAAALAFHAHAPPHAPR